MGNFSVALEAADLEVESGALAAGIEFIDMSSTLSDLVSARDLRTLPIHRWYYYKEGFSPKLPRYLIDVLGSGSTNTVADTFGGVGTTALSLSTHPKVRKVISVEYSPFASFVAEVKLNVDKYDSVSLLPQVDRLLSWTPSVTSSVPALAAFHNSEIFQSRVLAELLSARDSVMMDTKLTRLDRIFFLLGIAAIIEDVSGAMKDGRALRILRGRQRRRQGLVPSVGATDEMSVQAAIRNQWLAMIEDLGEVRHDQCYPTVVNSRGDARTLGALRDPNGENLIPDGSVGSFFYSPPYLNCLDYTEVYKLELWLLELVSDHNQFRALREGTLRSHPSIMFPDRPARAKPSAEVFSVIDKASKFLVENAARPSIGRIHEAYFSDMYEVLEEQYKALEPGGAIACVVANSTFSRRSKSNESVEEKWRLPVLTDVLIARIAEAVGFENIQIWIARTLRPKNVNGGHARESIVVARKPRT